MSSSTGFFGIGLGPKNSSAATTSDPINSGVLNAVRRPDCSAIWLRGKLEVVMISSTQTGSPDSHTAPGSPSPAVKTHLAVDSRKCERSSAGSQYQMFDGHIRRASPSPATMKACAADQPANRHMYSSADASTSCADPPWLAMIVICERNSSSCCFWYRSRRPCSAISSALRRIWRSR